jgi:hypothetical protein
MPDNDQGASGSEQGAQNYFYPILGGIVGLAAAASLVWFAVTASSSVTTSLVIGWSILPPVYFFFEYIVARRHRSPQDVERMLKTQELARHVWAGVVAAMIALASMKSNSG